MDLGRALKTLVDVKSEHVSIISKENLLPQTTDSSVWSLTHCGEGNRWRGNRSHGLFVFSSACVCCHFLPVSVGFHSFQSEDGFPGLHYALVVVPVVAGGRAGHGRAGQVEVGVGWDVLGRFQRCDGDFIWSVCGGTTRELSAQRDEVHTMFDV